MTPLRGKEALALYEQLKRSNSVDRLDYLEKAKADAAAHAKEPFDLQRLGTMCDIGCMGVMGGDEEQCRMAWEYRYYVEHEDVRTLSGFAERITCLLPWS